MHQKREKIMNKRFLTIIFLMLTASFSIAVTEVNAGTTPAYIGLWKNTVNGETLALLKDGVFINHKGQKGKYKVYDGKNLISIFGRTYRLKHDKKTLQLITVRPKMVMEFERVTKEKP